jgi:vacuolar-type H+-ATPase subunit H
MVDTTSPLKAIHQKELALRRQVEKAHCRAEAQIQAARQEAENVITQADREGQAKARAMFQQGLEEARQQAEAIVAAAYEEAAALRLRAKPRLDEVAERIVTFILAGENSVRF